MENQKNISKNFSIRTREAGAGNLAISVEGPSKAQIDFKDRKDGSCYVSYVVTEPGDTPFLHEMSLGTCAEVTLLFLFPKHIKNQKNAAQRLRARILSKIRMRIYLEHENTSGEGGKCGEKETQDAGIKNEAARK